MARPGAFKIDVDPQELRKLAADLKELAGGKKLVAALRKNLRAAAGPAADQVRRNASWSSRIPGAVGVQPRFTSKNPGVSVVVNARKAPHARPLESGSARNRGTVRHPVFGSRENWVSQPTRPFFFNQLEQHMPAVEKAVLDAMDEAARSAGFR